MGQTGWRNLRLRCLPAWAGGSRRRKESAKKVDRLERGVQHIASFREQAALMSNEQ